MKKIFSCVIVLAAAAMIGCAGNPNKKAAEAEGGEATRTEVSACAACAEKCDSTCCAEKCDSTCCAEKCDSTCCAEKCDSTKQCCADCTEKKSCCKAK